MAPTPKLYRVYIDESGDRGWASTSSPYFVFAALIVEDGAEPGLRSARNQLCIDMGKPTTTTLHWSQNIKNHEDRKYAAKTLGAQDVAFAYVIVDKAALRSAPSGLSDHVRMHNYAARRLLERLSWYVRDHNGVAYVTFAHIKNFKYVSFNSYLNQLRSTPGCSIHWPSFLGRPRQDAPNRMHLLQFADIAAGSLMGAISADKYGAVEFAYFSELQARLYRRGSAPVTTYGLHVVQGGGAATFLATLPWWPAFPK